MKLKQEPTKPQSSLRFPGGLISMLDKKQTLTPLHLKSLAQLQNNQRAGLNFESLNNNHLLCIRTNNKGRIILLIDRNANDEQTCYVVALFDNHEYNQLDDINVEHIKQKIANNDIGPVINLGDSGDTTQTNNESITVLQQSTSNIWTTAPYLNQNIVVFSQLQNSLIKPRPLPLVVTGAAGSGKTLIILQKMCDFLLNNLHQPPKKVLYCAPTQKLADEAHKSFLKLTQQQLEPIPEQALSQV